MRGLWHGVRQHADFVAVRRISLVQRLAGGRLGERLGIPVFFEDAAVTVPLDDVSFHHPVTPARLTAAAAAVVAAARSGAIAVSTEEMAKAAEDPRAAAVVAADAGASEIAALVARIAAIGGIADPFAPVDVAAPFAVRRLVVQPLLHPAAATHCAAASAALRTLGGNSLFIRPTEFWPA